MYVTLYRLLKQALFAIYLLLISYLNLLVCGVTPRGGGG